MKILVHILSLNFVLFDVLYFRLSLKQLKIPGAYKQILKQFVNTTALGGLMARSAKIIIKHDLFNTIEYNISINTVTIA